MEDRFETFAVTIALLNRCVQRIKGLEMSQLGLRGNHTMCLYYLGKHPEGLTAAELSARSQEDKAAVSRTVAELIQRNLVYSPGGYRALLQLTETGMEVADQVRQRVEHALEIGGAGLTEESRDTFYQTMLQIAGNLQAFLAEADEV